MQTWGRPERIRMDNGSPWGTHSPLPSALGLWLVGLGITPVYGRPARSTDNAIVERNHGVLAHWVEAHTCPDFATCQQRLQWAVVTQRERYRLPHHYTRAHAFPDLYTRPRPYQSEHDAALWCLQRVLNYLADFTFQRKVELNGVITLFANPYSVGKQFARQTLQVKFDPRSRTWGFFDDYAREVCRLPHKEFSYDQITHFRLAKRRK